MWLCWCPANSHFYRGINMERRDEDWINPPEPKMGYNGYFFELEEEEDDG